MEIVNSQRKRKKKFKSQFLQPATHFYFMQQNPQNYGNVRSCVRYKNGIFCVVASVPTGTGVCTYDFQEKAK